MWCILWLYIASAPECNNGIHTEVQILEKHWRLSKRESLITLVVCGEKRIKKITQYDQKDAFKGCCVGCLWVGGGGQSYIACVNCSEAHSRSVCQWGILVGLENIKEIECEREDGTLNRCARTNNVSHLSSSIYSCRLLSSNPLLSPSKYSHYEGNSKRLEWSTCSFFSTTLKLLVCYNMQCTSSSWETLLQIMLLWDAMASS